MVGSYLLCRPRISKNRYKLDNTFLGVVNDDLDFSYGSSVSPKQGCGVTLLGQFWYLGGYESQYKRQVSPKGL